MEKTDGSAGDRKKRDGKDRLERVRSGLGREGFDIAFVHSPQNRFYLSGFNGSEGVLVLTREQAVLFVDFRYAEQAEMQVTDGCESVVLSSLKGQAVIEYGREKGWIGSAPLRVGMEGNFVSWLVYEEYKELMDGCGMADISRLLARWRRIKDDGEIQMLQKAAALADRGFASVLQEIRPGKTERDIALALEFAMRDWGAEGCSFDFIVASGLRSSMPHALASECVLQRGDFVTMDFGVKVGGYCSDITRTVCLGGATERQKEIYRIVGEAQEEGIRALRAGRICREVDACARGIIEEAGYGEYYGHGLGHGVGLAVHEEPYLNTRDETVLCPGMVVTVEPGIYLPGWGGVRIEDMAVVTEKGAQVLTQAPKEFIIIE